MDKEKKLRIIIYEKYRLSWVYAKIFQSVLVSYKKVQNVLKLLAGVHI